MATNNYQNIPTEITLLPQWVMWKYVQKRGTKKPDKIPFTIAGEAAAVNNPSTWNTYDKALAALKTDKFNGIGFVVTKNDPYTGVDFDYCIDAAGIINPTIADYIRRLNSYTEITVSNKGLRTLIKGKLPITGTGKQQDNGYGKIEIYQFGRYFTMSGNVLAEYPCTIEERQPIINELWQEVFSEKEKTAPKQNPQQTPPDMAEVEQAINFIIEENNRTGLIYNNHAAWLQLMLALASLGEPARPLAVKLTCENKKYTDTAAAADKKFTQCCRDYGKCSGEPVTWLSIFAMANTHGWKAPETGEAAEPEATIAPELQNLIDQYGEPYYLNNAAGSVAAINQTFWASLHQAERIQLFEPDERAFYRYNPENGLYSIVSEDVIKQEIASRILEVSRQQGQASLERKRTNSNLNHIVAQLKGISEKKNAFRRGNKFIHLANGVIVFKDSGEADFCDFSPDFYSRNQCPIPFNPSATCERFFNDLLYPAGTADDAVLLQKYAGLCLLGNNLIQRLLILDGEPGRGKSTLALIIQSLVGQVNVTELRTRHLSDRFELFRYLKKNLLVGVDVPGQFLTEKGAHVIKGLVGGDWFDAEQKCGTGSFPFQGNFCILITSNSRLQVHLDGDTGAWKRRLLIIRFEAPPPDKKIPQFDELLIREEGSGILNWALQGLGMLLADIEEYGDIKMTEPQGKTVDGLLAESDSLRHFLMENIVQDENADLSTTEIVEAYAEYCPRKGWNPKPITVIQRELESLMLGHFGTAKAHSIHRDGKSTKGFRRVAFKK